MQYVEVVVGGQYGSEAKGHVTAQLVQMALEDARVNQVEDYELWNVRVAGPNAGHTVYDASGRKYAFRQLPVGAVIDPEVKLYIAPGSEIDLDVLKAEIALAADGGHSVAGRLWISRQATIIDGSHKRAESDTELVERVGSTGKGIGAARADRIMRLALTTWQAFAEVNEKSLHWRWAEPEDLYADDQIVHDKNQHVVIEGTQGYGLSLRASGLYPQTTSSDCRAVDFLAMAGIDPTRCNVDITNWVVARVHPIRVAGNSGPMKGETTWDELGLEAEKTTVTQKVRRVGEWDPELLARAVQANGGHRAKVVITMMDHAIPELAEFAKVYAELGEDLDLGDYTVLDQVATWLNENAGMEMIGAPVAGFTFSPTQILWTGHAQRDGGQETELPPGVAEAVNQALSGLLGDDMDVQVRGEAL